MPLIVFGIFDFDTDSAELRRNHVPVRIQAQPARVLAALLATPGEIVTRDSLRDAVWHGETFVDFDAGLNFCIAQVRSALGDSAESPLFVRTVPRKGYQFIAPVQPFGAVTAAVPEAPGVLKRGRRFWLAAGCTTAGVLAAAGLGLRTFSGMKPTVTVAITRFDNQTGSEEGELLADQITDLLVAELAALGTGQYGVIGNAAQLRVPRRQRDPKRISAELNAHYIVIGQVQPDSDRNLVIASLLRMPEQTHIGVKRVIVGAQATSGKEGAQLIASAFNVVLLGERDGKRASQAAATR